MQIDIERLGPIIEPSLLPPGDGGNINGPCCLEVPKWCKNRLGRFYLYFAHHRGSYIRLACSDALTHGWKNVPGGVLNLEKFNDAHDHIASPEIFVDEEQKEIRLYFHAPSKTKKEQWTFLATSSDGLSFSEVVDVPLAPFYLRVFRFKEHFYGLSKGGNLWRSRNGRQEFEQGNNIFDKSLSNEIWHNHKGSVRHVGILKKEECLLIFYSKIGDEPERIYCATVDLSCDDWKLWQAGPQREVIRPEEKYEGAHLRLVESQAGTAHTPENALRDPYVFETSGHTYLFYSVQGECGIAVCKIKISPYRVGL